MANLNLQERLKEPPYQAIFLAAIGLVLMALSRLASLVGMAQVSTIFPWTIAAAFLMLFAILCSLMSLQADSFTRYFGKAVYSYMGYALVMGLLAKLFSGLSIGEAGSYKWLFVVATFGFLVFLSMVNFMKKIVQFAEKEEWNEPRRRK